jgi:Leucine-rich repeat (LRR) protein
VQEINLSSKDLKIFPLDILNQTDVEKLDLSTNTGHWDSWVNPNEFTTLPEDINKLRCLTIFNLARTCLEYLPSTFGQLQKLKELDLSSTKLKAFPNQVMEITGLEILNLSYCLIETIPEEISKLKKLKVLKMDSAGVKYIPQTIGQLDNLEELHLYNNFITELPKEIGLLKNLKIIMMGSYDANHNQITELPAEIGQLKKLEHIHFGNNRLKTLPREITGCVSLKEIALWCNDFEEIPEWLSEMNLKDLNFYTNKIQHLPTNYKFLANIPKLTLDKHLDKELASKRKWKWF